MMLVLLSRCQPGDKIMVISLARVRCHVFTVTDKIAGIKDKRQSSGISPIK
jgi:hypothetical protein